MKKGHKSSRSRTLQGFVKRHPDGFGFFIPDEQEVPDVYIPRGGMSGVMSNDRAEVEAFPEAGGGGRLRGQILRVTERNTRRVTGQLHIREPGRAVIKDESHAWGMDLKVSWDASTAVRDGEWVSVEILTYPDARAGFTGRVAAVIGDVMDPLNDIRRVLYTHEIPVDFSKQAISEASRLPAEVREQDMKDRKDLRHLAFITIDGVTAKDFDDAIYVETNEKGFLLYVAIADVSHYVREGSAIDEDAYERGTSVYFPNYVVPMLPEKLSNELCSLKPNVPRLAVVAEMRMNYNGDVTASSFYEGVIQSQARVTYGEAQELLDGTPVEKLAPVAHVIKTASDLANVLMKKRFREGSLDLELPETEIEIDEAGQPVDIIRSERLFSHRLIEELMLAANVAVAQFFVDKEVESLFRIHESPTEEDLESLSSFLATVGIQQSFSGGQVQKKITKALQSFSGHPKEHVLNIMTLRSMMQAKYSPHNVGHFGLGFENYSHFTSPIRRYPDLIVHRTLKARLMPHKGYRPMPLSELETAGTMLSACEQRSVKAERQFQAIKKARFMQQFVGQEFEGLISSVAKFGVFVLLRQFDVDGLVRLENLGHEEFDYDEELLRLVGRRSGFAYNIGDVLKVQVASADTEAGRIDFVLKDVKPKEEKRHGSPPKRPKRPEKRRKTEDDRRGVRKARVSKSRRKG